MLPGHDVFYRMSEGIRDSHSVIVCVSTAYCTSRNCKQELREARVKTKYLIPLVVDDAITAPDFPVGTVSNILSGLMYCDFRNFAARRGDYTRHLQDEAERLVRALYQQELVA